MRTWPYAIIAAGLLSLALTGPGMAEKPEPKPKPKPKLELLTETQEAVLRKEAVKVEVQSKRGDEARVKARLVVDGFPDDYSFRLGPESRRLRDRGQGEAQAQRPPAGGARVRRAGLRRGDPPAARQGGTSGRQPARTAAAQGLLAP